MCLLCVFVHRPSQTLHKAAVMNDTTDVTQLKPLKAVLSMLPCLFFLYVNGVMLFALLRKPLLLESSRYILFAHLLLTDSLQLVVTMLLYIIAVTMFNMISYVCVIITTIASIAVKISPLNLAVMSLERYVAVCFPLRHVDITTTRRTGNAIAVIWTVASLDSVTQIFVLVSHENKGFTVPRFCDRNSIFRLPIFSTLNISFTIIYFVLVGMVIIYTYIAIMITVKSASSCNSNASKAHRTVLLHLLQFCLCLTSTLFSLINRLWNINRNMAINVQYALFLGLIIFPKCLSPLIYGLRDHTFRHIFIYYFTFGLKSNVRPVIKT
ncbi:odorant receptor 131-2-like [Hippoglossus stenolepis]|uniref:odorant receptor 131-2-like n=1 Tax=Hippoglossus stenolepis TaxID=195615 RepID=UPI00159C1D8C|nr:odorant receptor 131-2-like [Hippoglossus stenolepis]